MMQTEKIYKCFEDTATLDKSCMDELEIMLTAAPYFQPGWMLLAKAHYKNDTAGYRDVLARTAARVFDREQLYDFIYLPEKAGKKQETQQAVEEQKPAVAEKPQAPKAISKDDGSEVKSKEELQQMVKQRLEAIEREKKAQKQTRKTQDKAPAEASETAKTPCTKVVNKQDKNKIIERFIKQNPGISKPEDKDYKEELEIAEKSLDDKLDFVSETLAEIYYKQGHIQKAIKIYKQLSLKYPEKSSYFAAQIQKLETKD